MPDYGDDYDYFPEKPALDQTTKDALLGLEGLPFRTKPAVANEAAQAQTGSSPASVAATAVGPARPPSPSASVAPLGHASPHEGPGVVRRFGYTMKNMADPLIIPGPRTGGNDDQVTFSPLPRTDTLMSMSTESTGTPITPLRRSNTEFSTSSAATADTVATSPTGSCDARQEHMHQSPRSPVGRPKVSPHAHNTTSSAATSEFDSVVSDAKTPIKSSMSRAQDAFGPDPKSERSVRWADMETPKPLAPRKTMPISQGLGEASIEAPKPLVSHSTFPLTSQELTACAADVSSSLLRGASPGTEKAITGVSGPKRPPTGTLSLTQLRVAMMEAGLSGEAESEDRVIKFIHACQSQTVRGMTESKENVRDDVMASSHPIGPGVAQPRTPERSMAPSAASTPTPEREVSPTAQWTPSTSSDEGSDQGVYSSVMCEELGEKSQDQFTQNIYAVILQHTPGAVLDELDQSLKELAIRCVERAANLAQARLNKRASAIAAAAAEFSGDSLQHNNEPSPCDGSSSTHPANAGGDGVSFGQGREQSNPRKRPNDSFDGDSDDDSFSQGDGGGKDGQGGGTRAKKTKTGGILSEGKPMSCPYRKRNPLRFNIRDHVSCATQGHADMARLKRHIRMFHDSEQGKAKCRRCKTVFKTVDALDRHQTKDRWCNLREEVVNMDPENGITKEMEAGINDRRKGFKVDTWEALWGLLFPHDIPNGKTVPKSDFVPAIELFEVRHEFDLGDEEAPPLRSRNKDCQQYVERKFDICINDPTKKREKQGDAHVDAPRPVSGTNSLPVFGSAGAPTGPPQHSFATPLRPIRTAPPGQSGRLQQLTPDLTPVGTFPSHTTSDSPLVNRQNHNVDSKRRPQHGSPPIPNYNNAGLGTLPPSKHTATSNLTSQSIPSLPLLAPRPDLTTKAKEKAASSALQVMPYPPIATSSYQSRVNGMGHNNTSCGLNLINNSIMAGGMSDGRSQMDGWLGMIGDSNTMSPVAAGKQPEGRFMRRQSSSAETAIYNPSVSPQQQQQQPGSFTPDMNDEHVNAGDGSGLIVSYASGGVADTTDNAAMFSPSQVLVSTAAPTAIAMVTASGCPSFPIPAGCDVVDPFTDLLSDLGPEVDVGGGPAVTSAGDVDFCGMAPFMPGNDQHSAHAHAQPHDDGMVDVMEFTPVWPDAGVRPSGF